MIPKKPTSITVCESPAERKCYKYINTIAMKYTLQLTCQEKFGSKEGGYGSKKEWGEEHGNDYPGYEDYREYVNESSWEDTSWRSEKYRVDFILTCDYFKLIIEIDGQEFHQDELKEKIRDAYFKNQGIDTLHIPAKVALFDSYKVYSLIIDKLNFITNSDDYNLERLI